MLLITAGSKKNTKKLSTAGTQKIYKTKAKCPHGLTTARAFHPHARGRYSLKQRTNYPTSDNSMGCIAEQHISITNTILIKYKKTSRSQSMDL